MSCVLRRNLPKVRRNPRAQVLGRFLPAVKKMAPSSREATGPEGPDGSPIFGSVATWDNGPEVPDACMLLGVFGGLLMCHK